VEDLDMSMQSPIKYIKNANTTYPQWDIKVTEAIMEKFKRFHKVLRSNGYNVRCANVAEKDNKFYWILLADDNENYKLEQYGYIKG
jgi:hypothetical protein